MQKHSRLIISARIVLFILLLVGIGITLDWVVAYPIDATQQSFLHPIFVELLFTAILVYLNVHYWRKARAQQGSVSDKPIRLGMILGAMVMALILDMVIYGVATGFSGCPIGQKSEASDVVGQSYVCVPWYTDTQGLSG